MKLSAVVLGSVIMLSGFAVMAQAQAPAVDAAVKAVNVGNKICPVSGEKISADSGMMPATYEYKGKIYNFCCSGCIGKFKAEPEKYSAIAEQEVAQEKAQVKK